MNIYKISISFLMLKKFEKSLKQNAAAIKQTTSYHYHGGNDFWMDQWV